MAQSNKVPLPISFGDEKPKNKEYSRSIQAVNRGITGNVFSRPQPLQKSAASQLKQFGSTKYPEQIVTLELDEAPKQKQAAQEIVAVVEPNYYSNDLSSHAVKEQSVSQVLSGLTAVLVKYSQDIDIKIDEKSNCIEGIVFVEEYYGVHFQINVWSENTQNGVKNTRFELLRIDGDAMATAKFLGDIKSQFFEEEHEMDNFVSLNLDTSGLDLKGLFDDLSMDDMKKNEDGNISKKELDEINQALIENEMGSIDELQFLHERLKENGAISKDVIGHKQLVRTILNEALKNKDVCIVRSCLLILEQLCMEKGIGSLLVEEYALIHHLTDLVVNGEYSLIKNYSVRLLSKLSGYSMNQENAKKIKSLIEQYQNEWKNSILANNGFLNDRIFAKIYEKLSECK